MQWKTLLIGWLASLLFIACNNDEPAVDEMVDMNTSPDAFTGYVYRFPNLNQKMWDRLDTLEEMLKASAVPQSKLRQMSTEGLSQTCLLWPLYINYMAYPTASLSQYDAIHIMIDHFNGLEELTRRAEGGHALMKLYKYFRIGTETRDYWDFEVPMSELRSSLRKDYLELLLTTEYWTPHFTRSELRELGWMVEDQILQAIADVNQSWRGTLLYSYALWTRILLCYDTLEGGTLLTSDERDLCEKNILYLGMPELEDLEGAVSFIDAKKQVVLGVSAEGIQSTSHIIINEEKTLRR